MKKTHLREHHNRKKQEEFDALLIAKEDRELRARFHVEGELLLHPTDKQCEDSPERVVYSELISGKPLDRAIMMTGLRPNPGIKSTPPPRKAAAQPAVQPTFSIDPFRNGRDVEAEMLISTLVMGGRISFQEGLILKRKLH